MKVFSAVLVLLGLTLVQGCGRPSIQGTRIIGGTFAKKGAWPWQVSLYYNRHFLCGGSLLNTRWMVTAAHCVDGFKAANYHVVLGDHDRETIDHDEQVFKAKIAFHHPLWNKYKLNNDIALIKLDRPAQLTKYVQPICLPSAPAKVGSLCYITGWGQYTVGKMGPPSYILKQAQLEVISKKACAALNTHNLGIAITDQMVCAKWHNDRQDSGCHGDSGGPFVCRNDAGIWELQGDVSWGSGVCDARQANTVFGNIYGFKSWIEKYIHK